MEPENDCFQKESPFPGTSFQVPCQISGMYLLLKLEKPCFLSRESIIHHPSIFATNFSSPCLPANHRRRRKIENRNGQVLEVQEVYGLRFIRLRNPWGKDAWRNSRGIVVCWGDVVEGMWTTGKNPSHSVFCLVVCFLQFLGFIISYKVRDAKKKRCFLVKAVWNQWQLSTTFALMYPKRLGSGSTIRFTSVEATRQDVSTVYVKRLGCFPATAANDKV